eukprot:4699019-Alexandrium_andersonii.AAC.1
MLRPLNATACPTHARMRGARDERVQHAHGGGDYGQWLSDTLAIYLRAPCLAIRADGGVAAVANPPALS